MYLSLFSKGLFPNSGALFFGGGRGRDDSEVPEILHVWTVRDVLEVKGIGNFSPHSSS